MNIENKKQVAIIALAIGLGLVAAVLTGNYIQNSIKQETARLSQEYENKKIKPLLQEIDGLKQQMQKLAAEQAAAARRGGGAVQEAVGPTPKTSLALRTPPGKRAYTILIDSLSAVGGLVGPGDFVDIIGHFSMPDPATNTKEAITSMVFQNVQILGVGTNLQGPGSYEQQQGRALILTFALTPEEAGLMAFLQRNGNLQLVLRSPSETETQIMQISTWTTLADYVFEKQGTELVIPRSRASVEPVQQAPKDEVKPFIQIYSGGKEL